MDFNVNFGILDGIFAVPNCVVDKHIKLAGAVQLKALLYILRHSGEPINYEEMASQLSFSCADTKDAVNYWKEVGVLLEIDATNTPQPAEIKRETKVIQAIAPAVLQVPSPVIENGNLKKLTTTNRFSQKEAFTRMESSEEIKFLVDQCRALLARELLGSDVAALVSIHDWVGLPLDVILMAVEYCASQRRTDMRSVERQCTSWADRGINTHEQAEAFIKAKAAQHIHENLIQSAFGISGRSLSAKERDAIAAWFNDYGYDLPVIRIAYDKTVDSTGKLSFAYLSKILSNWHEKGIKTAEQAAAESITKPQKSSNGSSFDISSFENESINSTPEI